jgi:hypothetical protein
MLRAGPRRAVLKFSSSVCSRLAHTRCAQHALSPLRRLYALYDGLIVIILARGQSDWICDICTHQWTPSVEQSTTWTLTGSKARQSWAPTDLETSGYKRGLVLAYVMPAGALGRHSQHAKLFKSVPMCSLGTVTAKCSLTAKFPTDLSFYVSIGQLVRKQS